VIVVPPGSCSPFIPSHPLGFLSAPFSSSPQNSSPQAFNRLAICCMYVREHPSLFSLFLAVAANSTRPFFDFFLNFFRFCACAQEEEG
jgi:hypothetical protein